MARPKSHPAKRSRRPRQHPKVGKTCFATAIARAVALGQPFLGEPVAQSPILWCAHEESWQERVPLHEGLTTDDPFLIAYPSELPPIAPRLPKLDSLGRRDLTNFEPPFVFQHALEVKAKLIVIDCLHAAVEGANLTENHVARGVMGMLRGWSLVYNMSVLVLHHLTKSQSRNHHPDRFADSVQILASASSHLYLDRIPETATRSRLILQGRGRYPEPPSRMEVISEGVLDYRLAEPEAPKASRATHESRVLQLLESGWSLTAQEISARLHMNPATVRGILANLRHHGSITVEPSGERSMRYTMPTPSSLPPLPEEDDHE